MPTVETRLLYLDRTEQRGCDLFRAARERDLDRIGWLEPGEPTLNRRPRC